MASRPAIDMIVIAFKLERIFEQLLQKKTVIIFEIQLSHLGRFKNDVKFSKTLFFIEGFSINPNSHRKTPRRVCQACPGGASRPLLSNEQVCGSLHATGSGLKKVAE